jgi:hypothetical protein
MKDFFISYNKNDMLWAKGIGEWLKEAGYSYVMQETDFQPGSNFILEMDNATKVARRTISILSPDYLDALYTPPEWAAAFAKDPTGEKRLLIPVKVRDCNLTGLLAQIVFIDLVGLNVKQAQKVFLDAIQDLKDQSCDIRNNIAPRSSEPKRKPKYTPKKVESKTFMTIIGNRNVQVAGDYIVSEKQPIKNILPPADSIGADPLLKQRITTLFNKIGEQREKRFGKRAYSVLYSNFKRDWGIKNNKYTIIWTWPKECAPAIIEYLEDKYNNTIQGRIERAASMKGYIHTRPQLYRKEIELLEHLELNMKSQEVRMLLEAYFGASSHTQLSHLNHWQLVCYLEGLVKQIEET